MYVKTVDDNCCFFISLKTACLLIAYFLLLSQSLGVLLALFLFSTNGDFLETLQVKPEDFWGNVTILLLSVGLFLVLSIALLSFTVVLLVGLHKDDSRLIKMYLVFSSVVLSISIVFCFVSEFVFVMNPTATLQRVLGVAMNAFFLYVIRNYWIRLESSNLKLYQFA